MNVVQSLKGCLSQKRILSFCTAFFVFSALNFLPASLHAKPCKCNSSNELELGLQLETNFWKTVQKQNIDKLSKKIARIFQGINIAGIYTREEQISGLTGVTLTNFAITHPVSHCRKDVLVFSYDFFAPVESGLINGPTLSVWKKFGDSWKMVSHSYVPFLSD